MKKTILFLALASFVLGSCESDKTVPSDESLISGVTGTVVQDVDLTFDSPSDSTEPGSDALTTKDTYYILKLCPDGTKDCLELTSSFVGDSTMPGTDAIRIDLTKGPIRFNIGYRK